MGRAAVRPFSALVVFGSPLTANTLDCRVFFHAQRQATSFTPRISARSQPELPQVGQVEPLRLIDDARFAYCFLGQDIGRMDGRDERELPVLGFRRASMPGDRLEDGCGQFPRAQEA